MEIEREGLLPSGKKIVIKQGKGKHLRSAQRMMTEGSTNSDLARSLATFLCTVDGAELNVEDFDEMELADVAAIEACFLEKVSASIKS